jgi:uncharacterized protein YegP (UPF0339 family)
MENVITLLIIIKMGGDKLERFEIRQSQDGQYYFTVIAPNNEIIATSEMYTTKQSCQNGIESVKGNASDAPVEDKTD